MSQDLHEDVPNAFPKGKFSNWFFNLEMKFLVLSTKMLPQKSYGLNLSKIAMFEDFELRYALNTHACDPETCSTLLE